MKNVDKTGYSHLLLLFLLIFFAGRGNSQTTQIHGKDEANETVEIIFPDISSEISGIQGEKSDESDKRIICFYSTLRVKNPVSKIKKNTFTKKSFNTNRIFYLLHIDLPPPSSDFCLA